MSGVRIQRVESQPVPPQPLELLASHVDEWAERHITPYAVVYALGYMAGRHLKPFEERDTIAWMNDGIIGRTTPRQGES